MILLVGGASRSGKSTLAKRLVRELGMSYFPFDSMITTLENLYPETGLRHLDDNRLFSRTLADFLAELIRHLEYEDMHLVLDPYQLLPVDYVQVFTGKRVPVVYLGYPHLTAAEKLNHIRRHQREQDWTRALPDAEMIPIINQYIAESKLMFHQCQEYRLPFFDTGTDFAGGVNGAFTHIQEVILPGG